MKPLFPPFVLIAYWSTFICLGTIMTLPYAILTYVFVTLHTMNWVVTVVLGTVMVLVCGFLVVGFLILLNGLVILTISIVYNDYFKEKIKELQVLPSE